MSEPAGSGPAEMNAPSVSWAQLLAILAFVGTIVFIAVSGSTADEDKVIDLTKFLIPSLIGGDAIVRNGRARNPNAKPKPTGVS